jgi:hypothetical protein
VADRRLLGGVALLASGSAVVVLSLFATWYEPRGGGITGNLDRIADLVSPRTGWRAFEVFDVVLGWLTTYGVVLTAMAIEGRTWSPRRAALMAVPFALAAGWVLVRLVEPPDLATGGLGVDLSWGGPLALWGLALAASGVALTSRRD